MAEKSSHLDPRIQRTRKYLREALIELVLEKGYQNISVKDLADRACINRSTFYLHYQDKEELLTLGFVDHWNQVLPGTQMYIYHKPILPLDRLQSVLESDLEYFDQQRDFYRIMLIEQEIPAFRDNLYQHLLKITRQRFSPLLSLASAAPSSLPLLHSWLAWSYFGVIQNWLENRQPESPVILASQLGELFIHQLNGTFIPDTISSPEWSRQMQAA